MKPIILLFLFVFSMPLMAYDEDSDYLQLLPIDCASWSKNRNLVSVKQIEQRIYIAGYLDAFNALTPDVYDIAGSSMFDDLLLWMDKFCYDYPLMYIDDGLLLRTYELWPNRVISYPVK